MQFIERGRGTPLVLIPGLQGRWEYAKATVDALSEAFRVITFSLGDEPSAEFPYDAARGFDSYADQLGAVMERAGVDRAIICGVSFGGLIALRFAARNPERTAALVLASTPGPGWHLRPRHDVYASWPRIFGPLFLMEVPLRARRELLAALPARRERLLFRRQLFRTLASAPVSLTRMAARARQIATYDQAADCARITAPTLVVTGEAALDHVVAVDGSSRYAELIPGASRIVLQHSGHLGTVTQAHTFATVVRNFVDGQATLRSASASSSGRVA
ncbi:MAG TPA: alpha/beta hydrolase [Vicinamibacterales bacterium]